MSSLIPSRRLLLDENVHHKLTEVLRAQSFEIATVAKGSTDRKIVRASLREQRIVVTNDGDFRFYSNRQVHGVIWLRIEQHNFRLMADMIAKVFTEYPDLAGRLVIITPAGWKAFPLAARRS